MDTPLSPDVVSLPDRLRCCAQLWVEAQDATFARLGRTVINDGGFFSRIDVPGASVTTATLEKFARFLGDVANWPHEQVPPVVRDFVLAVGVTPDTNAPSTGLSSDMSGQDERHGTTNGNKSVHQSKAGEATGISASPVAGQEAA